MAAQDEDRIQPVAEAALIRWIDIQLLSISLLQMYKINTQMSIRWSSAMEILKKDQFWPSWPWQKRSLSAVSTVSGFVWESKPAPKHLNSVRGSVGLTLNTKPDTCPHLFLVWVLRKLQILLGLLCHSGCFSIEIAWTGSIRILASLVLSHKPVHISTSFEQKHWNQGQVISRGRLWFQLRTTFLGSGLHMLWLKCSE